MYEKGPFFIDGDEVLRSEHEPYCVAMEFRRPNRDIHTYVKLMQLRIGEEREKSVHARDLNGVHVPRVCVCVCIDIF